jgi:vancomycin resistance protein VanJ
MYGPLRYLALPPIILLLLAASINRRTAITLIPAVLLIVGPVAGFCIPWGSWVAGQPARPSLRVMTCNMHHAQIPLEPIDSLLAETHPDVVALQEWRDYAAATPFAAGEWHIHRDHGLFLASRHPIRGAERFGRDSMGEHASIARYELDTPDGLVTLFSLHLASPREGLGEAAKGDLDLGGLAANSERRWNQSRYLASLAAATSGRVLLVGDFNTPPQSAISRQIWDQYDDAFSTSGWGWGYTFRARISAVRIDRILVGGGGRATRCWVGPDLGSPHRPVLADIAWPSSE